MVTAASLTASFQATQAALQVLAALHLTDYLWPPQTSVSNGDAFDFIVVGAGSAGSVVAARLAQAKQKVLLVEGGDNPPFESVVPSLASYLPRSKASWNYTTPASQCYINNKMDLYAAKMLSGTNGQNALMYVRGNPHDYELWTEAVKDTAWSYDELLPYFKMSENLKDEAILKSSTASYHGTDGPLEVTKIYDYSTYTGLDGYFEAVAEVGNKVVQDINGKDTLGYANIVYTTTVADGPKQTTAYAYLTPLKDNPNLNVLKKTLASRVIFDENMKAVALEVITENNETISLKAKKEIIISAGTMSSPKLLMLSGIGPKDHLEAMGVEVLVDLPVGHNLQDQSGIMLQYQMEASNATSTAASNPFKPKPIGTFTGFVALNKSQTYPDYQTVNNLYAHDSSKVFGSCYNFYGLSEHVCQQFDDATKGRNTLFTHMSILRPKSRGRVLLQSTDPRVNPSINLNFYSEPSDVEAIVDSIEDFIQLSNTTYFTSVNANLVYLDLPGCEDYEKGSREYWGCYAQCMAMTNYHYAGTCAMGSVVDSRLRVLNVTGLRVADASVMPAAPSGNTNAATIMIGEKTAAMIKEDYGL